VLITMLPHGKAVRAALVGGEPLVAHLAKGAVIIDMSSSSPVGTRDLAEELAASGIHLLDAPVSGGVKRAIDGSLAIMVGGAAEVIAKVRPLLDIMGKSIFETGAVGSGHAMKALNNYVSAAGLTAACEALQIGERFGLDPELMTDILNVSTGRNNSTEVKLKPFIIPKNYASGFSLGLMAKDLRTADDLARHLGVPAPFSAGVAALWDEALAALGPQADHTAIDEFVSGKRGS
jgi:3-hydroxyisobutyrate dehydrogenase